MPEEVRGQGPVAAQKAGGMPVQAPVVPAPPTGPAATGGASPAMAQASAKPPEAPVPAASEPSVPPPLPVWVQAIQVAAPGGVLGVLGVPGGEGEADVPTLDVAPASWRLVAQAAQAQGFTAFADLGGVDYPERAARFELILHVRDQGRGLVLRCRTAVGEGAVLPSLEPVYPGAGWPEREVYDLLGVGFEGNADLRRLMLPDDWQGHPLRRDYPLTGPRALDPGGPYAL